jgi:hypothetical protein
MVLHCVSLIVIMLVCDISDLASCYIVLDESPDKEQWEPTIESLFSQSSSRHFSIREAWAFDWPTHGEAF